MFPVCASMMELADEASSRKLRRLLMTGDVIRGEEVNVVGVKGERILCSLYASWLAEAGSAVFVPLSSSYYEVRDSLDALQSRLNETNFELYERKEELASLVYRSNKLSGPFIELSEDLALVPIFGDLTSAKLEAIERNVFKRAYRAQPDRLLVDFTGVGDIERGAAESMKNLLLSFKQMGIEPVLIGLKPAHARTLAPFKEELDVQVLHSAKTAVKKWFLT